MRLGCFEEEEAPAGRNRDGDHGHDGDDDEERAAKLGSQARPREEKTLWYNAAAYVCPPEGSMEWRGRKRERKKKKAHAHTHTNEKLDIHTARGKPIPRKGQPSRPRRAGPGCVNKCTRYHATCHAI